MAVFTKLIAGVWLAFTTAVDVAVTLPPVVGVPVAVPIFVILPLSRFAWVVRVVAVQVSESPG